MPSSTLRSRFPVWLCLLGAGCTGGPERADAGAPPGLLEEVTARNREMERRFRAGDLRGVAAIYADDAVLISGSGRRTTGREAIDRYWTSIENPVDWKLEVLEVRGGENVATQLGRSHLVTRRVGGQHTSVVDFAVVWVRGADGELRVAVDAYW